MKISNVVRNDILQLFFVILCFLLMVAVSYYFVSGIVEEQIFRNAQETFNTAEVTIRSDLREAEVALHYAGLISEQALAKGGSLEEIRSYLRLITSELNGKGERVPGLLHVYGYFYGRDFIGLNWGPPEDFVPEERAWYKAAQAAQGGVGLTSPFTDVVTGKTVISLAKTLFGSDGETLGIIALDIDFSHLSGYVEGLHFAQGGYGMLADENFTFIVHPVEENVNVAMTEINPRYNRFVEEIKTNPDQMIARRLLNRDDIPMVFIFRRIFNGWFLGIATPVTSYFREVNSMAITLSVLSVTFIAVIGFILVRLSISKTRSEEENKEKTSFLARMSHEIRTPMNSILGMAELIQRKAVSDDIKEYIEIIQQSGDNLLTIINDILDFSKMESGRLKIQKRNYDIASVINDMINMMRPRVAEKSLEFLVNMDSGIPTRLFGDDTRLRQILTNLLSNAVKYTRKGFVSLDIGMERQGDGLLKLSFTVSDSGIGIKKEDQGRLFKEFSRIEIKTKHGIEGTGLGLVITRALCRAMGGDVTFSSEYAEGSVFRAVIIQEFTDEKPAAAVIHPETKNVLIYDWRPRYAESISKTLSSLKVNVKSAAGFQEFTREMEEGDYDFAFVSSKYAMDCLHLPEKPVQLVVMVEPGEVSVYRDVTSVLIPVYSISAANVLNNVQGEILFRDTKNKQHFTAPDASVLIVDDITTNLRVAKELMAPYGMNVQTCLSGGEALNLLRNNRYDLVFMDHMMPGMDGVETSSFIRDLSSEDEYYRRLPIIALTANAVSGQKEFFLANGINDFLAKPIDIQKLDTILEKWLPPKKIMKEAAAQRTGQETAELFNMLGLDVSLGLRNCGGSIPVYFNILADFCRDAEQRLFQIAEALSRGDVKLYVTLVHALKGAALSVGATETGEKALWLEKIASSDGLSALKDRTNELLDNVRTLLGSIRDEIERRETKVTTELTGIFALRLEILKTALVEMDIEAVNRMLLTFTGLSLDSGTRAWIAEVEQLILMFEYDKAVEEINNFLGGSYED